ncbi:MAG TPA: hypothetical protein PLG89_12205 [Arenimonas sp.]|nr:hypothetical protein [Arenimonas sp.]
MSEQPDEADTRLYAEEADPADPTAPRDTNSRSQKAQAEKKAKLAHDNRIVAARDLLSTANGRAFLAWVLHDMQMCALNEGTVDPGFNASVSFFRAGQRDIGIKLHRLLLLADKRAYVALLSDHIS